ncbi:retrovirus-related pol polyprotein from transposon TNT 1-94 [Tanacetum coccineum]
MEEKLKKELHSVKLQLNSTMENNKIIEETVTVLKQEFKQKENKFLTDFSNLKHLNDKLENKLHSQDQSIQTVHMMLNPTMVYDQKTKTAIGAQNPFYLRQAKKAQPALYDGEELLKTHHVPVIVPSSEEDLELAEATRNKMHAKMNDSACVEKRVNITPPNYSKENFMATFTPQTQLTPEQVFWSLDLEKRKAEELKANAPPLPVLPPATVYPPNTPVHLVPRTLPTTSQVNIGLYVITQLFWDFEKTCKKRITPTGITEGERGFEQTKRCYLTEVIPFFNLLKEHFDGVQKSLVTEVRAMKAVFENLEAEVDQKFFDMHDAFTTAQKRIANLESENFNLRNKIQNDDHDSLIKHFSKLEVEHFNLQLKYQNLKERFGTIKPVTSSDAPLFDSLFVIRKLTEQIQSRGNTIRELKEKNSRLTKKNSDADPLFDLKAVVSRTKSNCKTSMPFNNPMNALGVETLHEIVEEAKVDRPLDTSLASACRYTKHSQELLEHVIGTCPKDFNPRDKQNASTTLLRKKRVTFVEPCETSTYNPPVKVEHQKINSPNAPGIPSIRVKGASAASGSKPRSNTKKYRTLPAKSALKQVEAPSRDQWPLTRNTPLKVLPTKQWKPTGRLLPLERQCPLVRSTALKSCCMSSDPQENVTSVAYNLACTNQPDPNYLVRGLPQFKFDKDHLCSACQLGKSKKSTHKPKMINTIMEVLHTLHMDLCYPLRVQIINGKKYILVIVDDFSRFTWVKFLRSKDETPAFVINLLKQLQVGLNKTVRFVRTDNGTEFVNKDLTDYYESVDITHEKTILITPQQNGIVERRNRTLVEAARTMLILSNASLFLWAEAMATACYTQNRSLVHTLHDKTPYELVHDKKLDLSFLHVFRALCYPTNDSKDLGKLKAKADIRFFVGYAPNRKGYRIYNKQTRKIMETIHVTFNELTRQTAPILSSPGPAPNLLTPGPISSGLVPNPAPAIPYVPPTTNELETLFQPMFDEYFKNPPAARLVPPTPAAQVLVN